MGRGAPERADLSDGEVGMEGSDTDAREKEGGRGAASDPGGGDEHRDVTCVGGVGMGEEVGEVEGEGRVGSWRGGEEGETS